MERPNSDENILNNDKNTESLIIPTLTALNGLLLGIQTLHWRERVLIPFTSRSLKIVIWTLNWKELKLIRTLKVNDVGLGQ